MKKSIGNMPAAQNYRPLVFLLCCVVLLPNLSITQAEETLGRLFFTPERRQSLDHQREMNVVEQSSAVPELTINGVVTRSSGKRTAWVNGVAQNERETSGGISVTPEPNNPGQVIVETSETPGTHARVGETVYRSTGETSNLLNGGQIIVKRQGAK
jgi:hypothetical protein